MPKNFPQPAGDTGSNWSQFMSKVSSAERRKRIVAVIAVTAVVLLIGTGVMARNGWFPRTDPITGAKIGWFGSENSPPELGGVAALRGRGGLSGPPTPTPQLSKEYLYAGSRLLAVEDANANAAPPADLAVWRPSNGYFYVLGGPGSQQTYHQWGQSGDVPVPGDYDGDGKTDFSIFRPSTGEWWVVNSSNGATGTTAFGQSGDTAVPADFDGDGKTDAAVYRRNEPAGLATFYVRQSSNGNWMVLQFGIQTDTPASADYDGDGRADIAVYRDSSSTFYSLNSANGQLQTANLNSTPGATPVPADYDGDGKANYALKSGNNWIILNPAGTATSSTTWQQSGDIPVQNDYDGEGIVDIAVWRPSNGTWLIRQSSLLGQSGELRQVQWGASGDIPVPAFYRR